MTNPFAMRWLLPAADDFRARLKQLREQETLDVPALRLLVQRALDTTQLERASKLVTERREALRAAGLGGFKLAIVSSHTTTLIASTLPAAALRHGIVVDVHKTDYGQAAQQLLDPNSELAQACPDAVLLAFDAAALGLAQPRFDEAEAEAAVESALDYIDALRRGGREHAGALSIVQTVVPPAETLFGSFDGQVAGSVRWLVDQFNTRLRTRLSDGDVALDTAFLAASVGLNQWFDPRLWHDAKMPFAVDAVPLYDDHLCRLIAALRGLTRKCLVLDLDNTLWGGIIGDDGLAGIKLGQGSGTGEAHLAVQAYALDLRRRGVVLAVCSKNEEDAARSPFREHAEMLIKEDHVSVFMANWVDKASNLRHIAKTLNIGVDSLVFLDDNPAEREQVRQALPEVAVPEIGDNPADYVRILAQAGYFETISFGEEDRARADMYTANAQRSAVLQKIGSLDDYHASLEMVCTLAPFDETGRPRIAQLINKSNQFNLTTHRYTEADVAAFTGDPSKYTLQVRLADKFGDNGIISVVIFDKGESEWTCDTWLMSCRVLGRRVEEAVLANVAAAARDAGAARLVGDYIPTAKNALVKEHFQKLGFTHVADRDDGGTRWSFDVTGFVAPTLPMQLV